MSEEPALSARAEEPRYCPHCGARVAARATSCLMCGNPLSLEALQERAVRPRSHWLFWMVAAAVSLLVLGVARWLLQPLLVPATATPTSGTTPTRTSTPTIPPTPSATPTVTPTPTPLPPRAHQVQFGDTLSSIAQRYDTTVEEILALNPGITPEQLQVGQVLLIPPALPTPGAVPSAEVEGPTATPGDFILHVVAPGETLLAIAEKYQVTVALIRAANPEIPPGSDVIRVNQTLIIPLGTPMPTLTPTPNPQATATPMQAYPAPPLLSPPDGAVFGGPRATIVLQWASVAVLRPSEWYELRITSGGMQPLVVRTRTTAYRMPAELYPPEGSSGREFRWRVRVVRQVWATGAYEPASEIGSGRTFRWLEAPPTPTPSPTP